jgi:hypothetical protein
MMGNAKKMRTTEFRRQQNSREVAKRVKDALTVTSKKKVVEKEEKED